MPTIFLDEPGVRLRKTGERLVVEVDERVLADLKLQDVDRIVVCEACGITADAVTLCLRHGIELSFLARGGDLLGRLAAVADGPDGELRRAQWALSQDPAQRVRLARLLVAAKLHGLRHRLARWSRQYPEAGVQLQAVDDLLVRVPETSEAELLGVEGAASRAYFACFPQHIKPPFSFAGRHRHPAPDAVNALLGFCYALVENEVCAAAVGAGLDLDIGFLHAVTRRRASLALDLLEECRPLLADGLALRLLNRAQLRPEHFGPGEQEGEVWLTEAGRAIVFRETERLWRQELTLQERRDTWRGHLRRQARDFAATVRWLQAGGEGEPPYQPLAGGLR